MAKKAATKTARKTETPTSTAPSFAELLATVATEPGLIDGAFSRFHNYSLGNQLLAMWQCAERGIKPGPMATYPAWHALGRQVRKGEKAIELCMPVTIKRTEKDAETGEETTRAFNKFIYRPRWFVLSQTDAVDGATFIAPPPPEWNKERALAALDITEAEFDMTDGNVLGYATGRRVAVSELATRPFAVLIHEIAHIILGHCDKASRLVDGETLTHADVEVEAESVALLICGSMNQPGLEYARGYIQAYLGRGGKFDDKTAQRIFKAADQILKAGLDIADKSVEEAA